MISPAEGVTIQFFSMVYLVILIERRHDYHFVTQPPTLAVLSGSGSRNPQTWDERSHVYDLRGGLHCKGSQHREDQEDQSTYKIQARRKTQCR